METIGGRVRAARDRRVWSQDELARATGMPKASISRIETGKTIPRRSSIRKLAEALGVDPGCGQILAKDQLVQAGGKSGGVSQHAARASGGVISTVGQ